MKYDSISLNIRKLFCVSCNSKNGPHSGTKLYISLWERKIKTHYLDSIWQFWPLWKGWSRSSITTSIFTICLGIRINFFYHLKKVERILKGSLDLIPLPSPSAKIQIMDREVCLTNKGKTLLIIVNKVLKTKSLLTLPSNVLPYYLK